MTVDLDPGYSPIRRRWDRRVLVAATATHLAANGLHGISHGHLSVPVPTGTEVIVAVVVFVLPVAGLLAVGLGKRRAGSALLVAVVAGGYALCSDVRQGWSSNSSRESST